MDRARGYALIATTHDASVMVGTYLNRCHEDVRAICRGNNPCRRRLIHLLRLSFDLQLDSGNPIRKKRYDPTHATPWKR